MTWWWLWAISTSLNQPVVGVDGILSSQLSAVSQDGSGREYEVGGSGQGISNGHRWSRWGGCHTYYVSDIRGVSNLNNNNNENKGSSEQEKEHEHEHFHHSLWFRTFGDISLPLSTEIDHHGVLLNPPLSFFKNLENSTDFFFARAFHGHQPGHYVVIDEGLKMKQKISFLEALQMLEITAKDNIDVENADEVVSTEDVNQSSKKGGDEGGLRVLIVSADTRFMKPDLHAEDYVAMTAVLMQVNTSASFVLVAYTKYLKIKQYDLLMKGNKKAM